MKIPTWAWLVGGGAALYYFMRKGTPATSSNFDSIAKFAVALNPGAMANNVGSGIWRITTPQGTVATLTPQSASSWLFTVLECPACAANAGFVGTTASGSLDQIKAAIPSLP